MQFPRTLLAVAWVLAAAGVANALPFAEQQTIAAYDRVSPSVVLVACQSLDPQTGQDYVSTGSGFALAGGYIVTDYHVIENAMVIRAVTEDETAVPVSLVGTAPYFDIALLKVSTSDITLPPAPLGTAEDMRLGQSIIAIGSPFGAEISVTSGIVSGLGREFSSHDVERELIQFDASVNPGQSGGPLVDSAGNVVGIIIAKASGGEAIGFASPIDWVVHLVPDLIRMGHPFRAEIGVQGFDVSEESAALFDITGQSGFMVEKVAPGSAAETAGLSGGQRVIVLGGREYVLGGDIIIAADGNPITGGRDLVRVLLTAHPGDRIKLEVMRDGNRATATVSVPEMEHWHDHVPDSDGRH